MTPELASGRNSSLLPHNLHLTVAWVKCVNVRAHNKKGKGCRTTRECRWYVSFSLSYTIELVTGIPQSVTHGQCNAVLTGTCFRAGGELACMTGYICR